MLVGPGAIKAVINDLRVDRVEPRLLLPAIASLGIIILDAVGRRGQEFVGPTLELVQRCERRLEAGEGDTLVSAQQFIAHSDLPCGDFGAQLGERVICTIAVRIAMIVALPGVAQCIGQFRGLRQEAGSGEPRAIALARLTEVLHGRLILVDQESEPGKLAESGGITGGREDIIAIDRPRTSARALDAPNRPVGPGVGEIELQALGIAIFDAPRVESLLVLPPAGRAYETLILDVNALATHGHGRILDALVLELQPVQLEIRRVGDQRISGLAIEPAEISLDERNGGFDFPEQPPVASRDLRTNARPQRDGVRVLRHTVLIDILPAKPSVDQRL